MFLNYSVHQEVIRTVYQLSYYQFSSVAQLCNSLGPHGLQHSRPPNPSTPGVYSNSCPSSQWCHPTVSSSVVPFSSCLQSSQHQGLFQWDSSLHQVAKVLEFQLQRQSFQWIFRTDFLLNGLVGSPCSPGDSQESFPTSQFKSINSVIHSQWPVTSWDFRSWKAFPKY